MTALACEGGTGLVTREIAATAEAIDWSDLDGAAGTAEGVLAMIAARMPSEPDVEFQAPAGCVLADGGRSLLSSVRAEIVICQLRPAARAVVQPYHTHPRPIAVRVLRGHLRLALFGATGPRLAEGHSSDDPAAPRFLREDGPGRTLTLHPEQGHLLEVDRATTLLVLRGPVAVPRPAGGT
jgi:hypothetical protein